ncbi:MAG: cytochrome c family protein [Deltaproteobacteria bacterium]|nr:cytochrome c family protein [Deltaproteobacteria bacterium]
MATKEELEKLKNRSPADWAIFVLGFVLAAALGFWLTPTILYAEKEQPMQFDHVLHMEQVSDGCKSCHTFREDGSFTGIPTLENCKECHSEEPQGENPNEKILAKHIAENKPIEWLVYAQQPDCVFFSHAAHTANAGLECTQCHGKQGETKTLRPYQYNRLTGYSRDLWGQSLIPLGSPPDRMKMDDCANCHRDNGVRDACFVCHK